MKFIIGAGDPEMKMIENILKEHKLHYEYAQKDGMCCHSGNAYEADGRGDNETWYIFIECKYADMSHCPMQTVIDHHRKGDKGYGQPPETFWKSSSLGQLVEFLRKSCIIDVYITQEMLMCAAADHCLLAAYQGKCEGVDPEKLMKWRISTRAKFQNRSEESILADVENARKILREKKGVYYADLRGMHIPELPEAAAREGIPFISSILDRDGRTKIIIQSAPSWLIEKFMSGEIIHDIKNIYGDPERGFAGGYIWFKDISRTHPA